MRATHTEFPLTIGVLLVDSNQMQSQLLLRALRRRPEFTLSLCESTEDAMFDAIESSGAQVVVMNAERDGHQDFNIVRQLHVARPELEIIILLERPDRESVVNAFRSGARGLFCLYDSPFRMLCKCIESVHRGQVWANSEQLQYLLAALTQVPSLRVVDSSGRKLLTPREEQVVALVADGLSNREISRELALSENTVKKYLFRIFDKLGVSSRVELVLYAVNNGEHREAEWVAS